MTRSDLQRFPVSDRNRSRRVAASLLAVVAAVGLLAGCQQNMTASPALLPAQTALAGAINANTAAPFQVGLSPSAPLPVKLGKPMGFQITSSQASYAHLYLLSASGKVTALGENLAIGPGMLRSYPESNAGFSLTATPPAGIDRAILLVTTQPFAGLAGSQGRPTAAPTPLNLSGAEFVDRFNRTTTALPASAWAATELPVPIVAQ